MNQRQVASRIPIVTSEAPPPAGSYSQAIDCQGLVFVSGQTPRLPDGRRLVGASFETQARQAFANVEEVARAAGTSLHNATMVTVFITDFENRAALDAVWREFVVEPYPARAVVQSNFPDFAIEVTAILAPGRLTGALDQVARAGR